MWQHWQPVNLTQVCPANTHITACSSIGFIYLNLLVELFGDSKDRRIQKDLHRELDCIEDELQRCGPKLRSNRDEYDFIVVGAGAAGCVVANRLSEIEGWKVLLLEAGPEQPDVTLVPGVSTALLGSNIDWLYRTQPDGKSCLARNSRSCAWPRGKTMGGSTSINSMSYVRGNRYDYDSWAALGNEGWSYKDVLPYFKKFENNLNVERLDTEYHGYKGPQYVSRYHYVDKPSIMLTEGFNEGGLPLLDFNGLKQEGTMQSQAFSKDGLRVSTNNAYIQPIRYKRKNLTVRPNSEVVKILINEDRRAYGVQYKRHGKIHKVTAKMEVIVSAGSIESPKLLMLSGIGPKNHLRELNINVIEDLPVGYNLHDHVTFNGIILALPNKTNTVVSHEAMFEEIENISYRFDRHSPLASNGATNSAAFLRTDPSLPAPDIQYQTDKAPDWREYIREPNTYDSINILPTPYYNAILPRTQNVAPKSRGYLCLNKTDPHGHPLIYANYFGDPTDLIPLIKGVRFLISLENTKAYKELGATFIKIPLPGCEHYKWGSDRYIECLARTYTSSPYHPVGSCKMGPKHDRGAVVDSKLRVYGISGLRVIDGSIMPIATRGNTGAPTIMIGEKGSDYIKDYWLKYEPHDHNE